MDAIVIRPARSDEIDTVAELWDEARSWLAESGVEQWQYPARREVIAANLANGDECWILEDGHGSVIGTVTVDMNADPEFWSPVDDPDSALYVHRMIVRRSASGREIGGAVLDWASLRAESAGKRWLRLDAWRTNARLMQYYIDHGFELVRIVQLSHRRSGALFQRRAGVTLNSGLSIKEGR